MGEFGDKFGFTNREVKDMLKEYGMIERYEEVKRWYNGYRVLDEEIYNPYSMLTFLRNRNIVNAWLESGDNKLAKNKIESFLQYDGSNCGDREKMERIMGGGEEEISYKQNIKIEASGADDVLSLLLSTGYLTFNYVNENERKDRRVKVRIPNKEVEEVYMDTLDINAIDRYRSKEFEDLLAKIERGAEKEVAKGIEEQLMGASFHDFENYDLMEKDYHNFLHGIFRGYIGRYEVKSNREAGKGRYDLMMIPKKNNKHKRGMIIEFKAENKKEREERERRKKGQAVKSDEDVAKEKSEEGLKQIKDKRYMEELKGKGIAKVRIIGMGFVGKSVGVTVEEINLS